MPKISPIAQAIREAVEVLGSKATTAEVKEKVLEMHPELADEVSAPRFSTRVAQNRSKKPSPGGAVAQSTPAATMPLLDKYDLADQFFCLCGANHRHAQDVLAFLSKANAEELRAALAAWEKLVQTAGGIEKARAILETMRAGGL